MLLTVKRSPDTFKDTSWRPVQKSIVQEQSVQTERRKINGPQRNKYIRRIQRISLQELDLLLAGGTKDTIEARIEDTYEPGKFVEGFVYIKALAAFVHRTEVARIEAQPQKISAGCIIAEGVRLRGDSHIGIGTELERGVQLHNASIGDNSVVRKGSIVVNAAIGGLSYIGQFTKVTSATVGSMYQGGRHVVISSGAEIGTQNRYGLQTHISRNAFVDDTVRIGAHGFIGADATIGEMFTAGPHLHVGEGAVIGAESEFGSFVRVARNIILASPTYASDGAVLMATTIGQRRANDSY